MERGHLRCGCGREGATSLIQNAGTLDLSVGSTSASALISSSSTWSWPPDAAQSTGVHKFEFLSIKNYTQGNIFSFLNEIKKSRIYTVVFSETKDIDEKKR